ncbi:hypothetical protein BD410DRAFT_902365 [Rickenella mellea]|uniref:Uncharacterized protein n=1 Tax=Rickenella mellea TaxID=50990 RepID=A0A4Y7PN02_9AGAM|nr:hypothetical protein BD410DRAFT_902365 [Rickenella mellea]
MSLRPHRQPSDRDVRMHDAHVPHPHPHGLSGPPPPPPPPPHGHPHSMHLNGSVPNTPGGMSNGSAHGHPPTSLVSPVVASNVAGHANGVAVHPSIQKLTKANEETWLLIGAVAEQMGDLDRALSAYENALRHNPLSVSGLTQVAGIARIRENYPKAVEYFQRVLNIQQDNGEVWSALGHCYLMQDDLQKAYSAYQQALYLLPNPKEDPKLWYGIGILYDRYGSLDHAEEAFASVLQMDKVDFDKANEILFRLGIIYKQQGKYHESLECFDRILRNPPSPLAHADIWFQIGHVYEQQKDHVRAKDAYERVVADNPHHAKVLQQLGWLYHQDGSSFQNQDLAITYLTKSLETDPSDAQSWYLLGRAYMAGQKYNKAYEAYQQAVYRDGRNPTFWCSIGVLYFQINQYRDALDAYSRAIRINPYISEVWFDLGSLYESCNNQISDAIDAYARASELDPNNPVITQRLQLLRNAQATGGQLPAAPGPQDVHPTAYASAVGPPVTMSGGPPLLMHGGAGPRPIFTRSDSRGPPPEGAIPLPSPHTQHAPAPFRGGPPPPVIIDDSRRIPNHTPLAPMEVDRPPMHSRDGPPPYQGRDSNGSSRGGPTGQSLLLHHPQPQSQQHSPEQAHPRDQFYGRRRSSSASPPPILRQRPSPQEGSYPGFGPGGGRPSAATQPPAVSQRSPRSYPSVPFDPISAGSPPTEREPWDRRSERGNRARGDSRSGAPLPPHSFSHSRGPPSPPHVYDRRGSPPPGPRPVSPRGRLEPQGPSQRSPIVTPPSGPGGPSSRQYWDSKPPVSLGPGRFDSSHSGPSPSLPSAATPSPTQEITRRYDPRFDDGPNSHRREAPERDHGVDRFDGRSHGGSPEGFRRHPQPPQTVSLPSPYEGQSMYPPAPLPMAAPSESKRRRAPKEKDAESARAPTPVGSSSSEPKDKKKRRTAAKKAKEDPGAVESAASRSASTQPQPFKVSVSSMVRSPPSPEPVSSASTSGSGSVRSGRPSPSVPTSAPVRPLDEDYDEGVADTLMSLARPIEHPPPVSPTDSVHRAERQSPHMSQAAHRRSISSASNSHSPPVSAGGSNSTLKRPLSPGPSESAAENKRSKIEFLNREQRRVSPPGRHSPLPPTRPSPIPFRTEVRMHDRSPPSSGSGSSGIPTSLPLPPPPSAVVAPILPPIATLSPATSTRGGSPAGDDERMQMDSGDSRSNSPPPPSASRSSKISDVMNPQSPTSTRTRHSASPPQRSPASRSPQEKASASPRS